MSRGTQEDVLQCSFPSWYPQFKHVTFPTRIVALPPDFVHMLVADNVSAALLDRAFPTPAAHNDDSDWSSDHHQDEPPDTPLVPPYDSVLAEVEQAIQDLGGTVAPRLNWSSPHDATWVLTCGTLACTNAQEVVLLLRSSDRAAHDVQLLQHTEHAPQPMLALRKWQHLRPEREFRCFVRDGRLVGVCQRNVTQHFPQLQGLETELAHRIDAFFDQHILATFPLRRYTADVYVASDSDAVRLIDFNPVGGTTSPLLFSWEELGLDDCENQAGPLRHDKRPPSALPPNGTADDTSRNPSFPVRIVTDPMGIQPDKAAYMVPFDFVDDGPGGAAEGIWERLQTLDVQK